VAQLLWTRQDRYKRLYDADVRLVAVCGSRAGIVDTDGLNASRLAAADALTPGLTGVDFLTGAGADVLIEAGPTDYQTGGAGYAYLKAALSQQMHAIAISKGALVFDYAGLHDLALKHRVSLKISGATSAALPTIDLLQYNLAGCEFSEVEGIFTATTNFVLSKMMDGMPFQAAVEEAQALGMAEPDPRFDVEGWDTACKVTILANAAFDAGLSLHDVARQGIDRISSDQIHAWKNAQQVPKLVGRIVRHEGGVAASVELRVYPVTHPFAQVAGKTKAIRVVTDVMGETLVIGGTSSQFATAAAALKDLEHILMRQV
jgi:homoserine dehydrogenase